MSSKDVDEIMKWIMYGSVFFLWATVTFLFYVNTENYQDDPYTALMGAILLPPVGFILFAGFCWIIFLRMNTRISAVRKIGTNEPWDWAETFEIYSMFSDWDD